MSRQSEIEKYKLAYSVPGEYGMKNKARMEQAQELIRSVAPFNSYLDMGCGRGEMISYAKRLGCEDSFGTEVVESLLDQPHTIYAEAHDLPFEDNLFEVVSSFDVFEHLISDDVMPALREIRRIAFRAVVLTIAFGPSSRKEWGELHITQWKPERWKEVISDVFCGAEICAPKSTLPHNQPWVIAL